MNSKPTNQPPSGMTPDNIEGHLNAFRDGYNAAMNNSEQGKVFIADFENKVVREKPWSMPPNYTGHPDNEYDIKRYLDKRVEVENHNNSLKQYPATWLTKEMDGKEMILGVDFIVKRFCEHDLSKCWCSANPPYRMEDNCTNWEYISCPNKSMLTTSMSATSAAPPSQPLGIEELTDEIYDIQDIDTVREMLIKAKQSSYQWCKKAMEAAQDRIQLQNEIKELKASSTSDEEKEMIIEFMKWCRDNHKMPILWDNIEPTANEFLSTYKISKR